MLVSNLKDRQGGYGHTNRRIKDINNFNKVDFLFIGSSHVYRGFDTRIFAEYGFQTFNLGTSGQTPNQTKFLLNRYLNKLKPKIIFFEVFPSAIFGDGAESSIDLLSNDKIDWQSFKMTLETNHIKSWNLFIYKSLEQFFDTNDEFTEPIKKNLDTYISGGFVERKKTNFGMNARSDYDFEIDFNKLEAYRKFVLEINQNEKYKAVLVFAPITKKLYENHYQKYQTMDSIYRSWPIEYLNFNILNGINDTLHFNDYHHLSQEGVEFFNPIFIEELEKLNLIR